MIRPRPDLSDHLQVRENPLLGFTEAHEEFSHGAWVIDLTHGMDKRPTIGPQYRGKPITGPYNRIDSPVLYDATKE